MKKRLVIISLSSPYPLSHGGAVAQYFFLERLVKDFDVDFLTIVETEKQKENLITLQSEIKGLNIVYLDNISISEKKVKLIEDYFKSILFWIYYRFERIIRVPSNKQHSYHFANERWVNFVDNHLKSNRYDICQLDFFETLNLTPILPKSTKKVFIHHEIRFKRFSNILDLKVDYNKYLISITKFLEISLLNTFDKVLVFNNNDLKSLEGILENVVLSPFGIPNKLIINKEFSNYFDFFFFLGSEDHAPNSDGLVWFLETIFIPNYEQINKPIKILGLWSDNFKSKYSNYYFIEFTGFVDSLSSIYLKGVLVSPIISGSGIRTKILESFANKAPVICNSFAAEGLFDDENNNHLLIFKDSTDFIKLVNSALKNDEIRKAIVNSAFDYYEAHFNSEFLYQKRLNIYKNL